MKLNQVVEWIGKSPMNQLIAVAAALVLLLLILFLLRRRSRKAKGGVQAAARIQATRNDLKEVFEGYRESHPTFYSVMSQIQANRRLDEFMSNNEFAGAIAKLRLWQAVRVGVKPAKPPAGVSPLTIQATPKKANPEVKAAMVTVLRILYSSPEISKDLPSTTEAELDKLLESLTA
ncbi:MAG: hypothetical protein ACE15E_23880 [Acidobacteriota bacterium]